MRRCLDYVQTELIYSGWPGHPRWWINQHMSRFFGRLRWSMAQTHEPRSVAAPRASRTDADRLRVGCIGAFSGLLGFPRELFEAFPQAWSLHAYDVEYRGQLAPYLRDIAVEYKPLAESTWGTPEAIAAAADAINRADLDVLMVIMHKAPAYALLDRVTTSCVAHVCTGQELLHHDRVSFHICPQIEADYFLKDDRLFCGTTRAPFPGAPVYFGFICCDPRDLTGSRIKSWSERENLIVVHGSLYKFASPDFLRTI